MSRVVKKLSAILIMTFIIANVSGCSKLTGPSDAEIVKAVQDSSLFLGGFIQLKSPVTVVEKMSRGNDGTWPVKVRATVSFKSNKQLSFKEHPKNAKPVEVTEEKTLIFKLRKVKDGSGNPLWKADIAG